MTTRLNLLWAHQQAAPLSQAELNWLGNVLPDHSWLAMGPDQPQPGVEGETPAAPHIRHGRRQAQYRMGRVLASCALNAMTGADHTVSRRADGSPAWPDHSVGSITHTQGLAAAIVASTRHYAGLGIDAERWRQLSPGALSYVCTAAERAASPNAALLSFSAKEAIFKTLDPLGVSPLRFQDVTVIETDGQLAFAPTRQCGWVKALEALEGVALCAGEHVVTLVWIRRDAGDALV